jgi:PAS domain S-box-containing protein
LEGISPSSIIVENYLGFIAAMKEEHENVRLRERAKGRLEGKRPARTGSEKDPAKLVEELSIHQEELNIQNEELMLVQVELEASRAKYFELYDLAPVGYITLNHDLIVKEANLAASLLLGTDRDLTINRGISAFISSECQELLYLHFRRLEQGDAKQKHVFILQRKDGSKPLVQFESNLIENGPDKGYRSILTDVTELNKTVQALKKSEGKYRNLFENMTEGFFLSELLSDEQGKPYDLAVLEANPSFQRQMSLPDPVGKTIRGLLPSVEQSWLNNYGQVARTGKPMHFENYNGGTGRWYDVYVYSPERGRVAAIFTDVTEHKKIEEALTESEALFRSMFKDNHASMLLVDPMTGDIIDANQVACDFYHYECEGLQRLKIFDINTLGPEEVRAEMDRSLNGEKRHFDFRHRLANGTIRDVEVYSGPIYVHGRPLLYSIIHDVTERKRIERELEDTKGLLEAIIRQMPIGILVADARSGEILIANDEIERLYGLGFRPTDIKVFGDYTRLARRHLDGRPYEVNEYPFVRSLKGEVIRNELAGVVRPDGSEVFISGSSAPVFDSNDNVVASVALSIDVTDSIKTQMERDRLLADAERSSKELKRSNAELEQFAYVASHDLREPLRMVRSYLGLLEKKYSGKVLDDKAEEYINFALDGATRMQTMIDDILIYARVGTQGKSHQLVDMEQVLGKVLNDLERELMESAAIVTAGPLPKIMADTSQMSQLLQNLIANAIKFRSKEASKICVSAERKGKEWAFAISDNGIGIPLDQQPRLFQMFQRLNARQDYPGTGIGLAICKKIVEQHGGRIWVESEVGKGSTFFFTLSMDKE